jgi:hypothetical protein
MLWASLRWSIICSGDTPIPHFILSATYPCIYTCIRTFMQTSFNLFLFYLPRLLISNTLPLTPTLPFVFLPLLFCALSVVLLRSSLSAFHPSYPTSCLLSHSELRCRGRTLCCPRSPPLPVYSLRWLYSRYITSPQHTALRSTMP